MQKSIQLYSITNIITNLADTIGKCTSCDLIMFDGVFVIDGCHTKVILTTQQIVCDIQYKLESINGVRIKTCDNM